MVSLASGRMSVFVFALSMLVGMTIVRWMRGPSRATMLPEAADAQ
jgi:hypothetical protein